MRDVAVISFSKRALVQSTLDDTELLAAVIGESVTASGVKRGDIGFTVSASCDYLGGRPFSFVSAIEAAFAWPPISESHVEMDGAWALYEAWVRLQHGDVDVALVYAFGRASQGSLRDVLVTQLDPYYVAPLAPDPYSLAGLQGRALVDAGRCSVDALADIVPRGTDLQDGAAAAILMAGDRAREACASPAWIAGIDHCIEAHALGARDLTRSTSTAIAARAAWGQSRDRTADVAHLDARFAHEEALLRAELLLDACVTVRRDSRPFIVSGLCRIGEAAQEIQGGSARRAVAHATSGPCLQQNLVCVLEGRS